jgi:hypothetical protein
LSACVSGGERRTVRSGAATGAAAAAGTTLGALVMVALFWPLLEGALRTS